MIEWIFSRIVQLLAWLWTSAMTLYYLAGFFIVAGGFVIFVGSVLHHYWKQSQHARVEPASSEWINVRIENLNITLELTEAQTRSLLAEDPRALPPAPQSGEADDLD